MKVEKYIMPNGQKRRPDDPRVWLDRAYSNLIRAKYEIPNVYLEDLCFDGRPKSTSSRVFGAQQAAEKALKALCIERGIDFPYVHDLAQLTTLLQEEGQAVPDDVKEAGRLTRYAVLTRYPGLNDPVTREDYERAVTIADRVVEWVSEQLGEDPGVGTGPNSDA